MNSTETFWEVDGHSLQTYAWNIETLGGDRAAPPPIRGSNQRIPYRPGSRFSPKVVDERVITLGMWVQGSQEDGKPPTDTSARLQWERNWRKLRKLLFRYRQEFTLTKRFWVLTADLEAAGVDTSGLPSQGLWSLYAASARASYGGGLSPKMNGDAHGVFTVDLVLTSAYFFGPTITIPFSTQTGGSNPGPNKTVSILGDDRTTRIEVDFEGPLTSPKIENLSGDGELWFQYGTNIAADEDALVKVHEFSASQSDTGGSWRTSGFVQHRGDKFWLYLDPEPTQLQLSVQSGTGTATLRYRPGWF